MLSRKVNLLGSDLRETKITDGRLVVVDRAEKHGFTCQVAFTKGLMGNISQNLPSQDAEVAAKKLMKRIDAVLKPARKALTSTPDGVIYRTYTCTVKGNVLCISVVLDGENLVFGNKEDFDVEITD